MVQILRQLFYDMDRWNRELAEDLYHMGVATATVWAQNVTDSVEAQLIPELMYDYLSTRSRAVSREINESTRASLAQQLLTVVAVEAVAAVVAQAVESRSRTIAESQVTATSNFGAVEGAKQAGLRTKTWHSNSANPRPDHLAINGETVGIREMFSNGLLWPGDPTGGPENNANCQCTVEFGVAK